MDPGKNSIVPQPITCPDALTPEWALTVKTALDWATMRDPVSLPEILPSKTVIKLFQEVSRVLHNEPTLVQVRLSKPGCDVVVVGDLHGHYHDLSKVFGLVGMPSEDRCFVFNGDYVDRGCWGVEVLTMLCAVKLCCPHDVILLRGDHETVSCSTTYGFKSELKAKYGADSFTEVYSSAKQMFAGLPLAAKLHKTLIMHGGLFRKPNPTCLGQTASRCATIGCVHHLRTAGKGGLDPSSLSRDVIARDVLWSDPTASPGWSNNTARSLGINWGPDVTEKFLSHNKLRLIIRSHESPDAREHRNCGLPALEQGYSFDHVCPSGRLVTLFSAPDYPMNQPITSQGDKCSSNVAAVAVLSGPDYCQPQFVVYDAAQRPKTVRYPSMKLDLMDLADEPMDEEGTAESPPIGWHCNISSLLKCCAFWR